MSIERKLLAIAIASWVNLPVLADDLSGKDSARQPDAVQTLDTVVVTAEKTAEPLKVVADPKAPKQPVPAHDGADYLKTVPGFAVTRKGGTDGDPVFRGMAGSRLNLLVDGGGILGGCNFRMDAPTAYVYPELYDSMTVIKGPQSVQYGPGNSAATVMFDRNINRFSAPGYRLHASALAGSADRQDVLADGRIGNDLGYLQFTGSDASANDYRDGNGDKVHSQYHRYSANAAVGWTPDDNTRVELAGNQSDGEAAYADRGMDGTQFRRDNASIRVERKNLSERVASVQAQVYQGNVDHIMDDQELRKPGMMGYADLVRDTSGGRLATTLVLSTDSLLTVGGDAQNNAHESRRAGPNHVYSAWGDDANFSQYGVFAELDHALTPSDRLVTGYRADRWEATDERAKVGMMMPMPNPSANTTRQDTLGSGFARIEHQLADSPATLYAGVGHAERFPDYWEMIAKESPTSVSAFDIRPETTNQLDAGYLYRTKDAHVSVSAFYNRIEDFILADYSSMMKMNGVSRNVDATTYGAEVDAGYRLDPYWTLDTGVAWVWGENRTDGTALAQLPPLEGRLGLTYARDDWSVGGLWRVVDHQNRYDLNKGNIVGKDLGESAGFAVFSLNAGWRPSKAVLLSAGVDNVFDKTYAEFVSRANGNGMGGAIPGYVQTDRVNEPGRTFWLKVQTDL